MLKRLIFVLLFAFLVASCNSRIPPEEEIREYITSVEKHFENRQAGKLKGYISDEYLDDYGYIKKDLLRFAAGYILRRPIIHIRTKITDLVILEDNNKARVQVDVAVTSEPFNDNDIRLRQGEFHRFVINLERTKAWQVRSLQWQNATIDEYLNDEK